MRDTKQQPTFDTMLKKFINAGFVLESSPHPTGNSVTMYRDDIAVRIIQHPDRLAVNVQFRFLYDDDNDTLKSMYN